MKLYRVVIATGETQEGLELRRALEATGQFQVLEVTDSGLSCVRAAAIERPDLVILDLLLREIDGLEVLDRLGKLTSPPQRLVLSSCSYSVTEQAGGKGACCILKPYQYRDVVRRALRLVEPQEAPFSDMDVERRLWTMFTELGAPIHMKGFRCAMEAIKMVYRSGCRLDPVMGFYERIGKMQGVAYTTVDKRLRDFVKVLFTRGNLAALERYFGYLPNPDRAAGMTNAGFLTAMANQLKFQLQDEQKAREETRRALA